MKHIYYLNFIIAFSLITIQSYALVINNEGKPSRSITNSEGIDNIIKNAINTRSFPGAQLVIGDTAGIIYANSYGHHDYTKQEPVEDDDIYDIASCTKVMSATVAVMKLVSEKKLSINSSIKEILPEYENTVIAALKLSDLLKHTSGFRPSIAIVQRLVSPQEGPLFSSRKSEKYPYLYDRGLYANSKTIYDPAYVSKEPRSDFHKMTDKLYVADTISNLIDSMILKSYNPLRRGCYTYSDLNFYMVQKIVERVSSQSLDSYVNSIYAKIGISNIGYTPITWKPKEKIIPTEFDCLLRKDTIQGYVHDEMACLLGGISGHAGLFSDASSMSIICKMLLNNGIHNGEQIIDSAVVKQFTSQQLPIGTARRALGFDMPNANVKEYSLNSYGHTGFTGTFFWIDPTKNIYVVLLTNRIYPSRSNKTFSSSFRENLWSNILSNIK